MKLLLALAAVGCLSAQSLPMGGIPPAAAGGTCLSGYAHCASVVIDHTLVGATGAPHSNFPVYFDVTLGASQLNNANCYDFAVTSAQSSTPLYWRLEPALCNSGTGRVAGHFLVSSLSSSVDTTVYFQWNGAQNTFQSTAASVWTAYTARWAMGGSGALDVTDDTGNGHNGTAASVTLDTSGVMDGAGLFDSVNSHDVTVGNSSDYYNNTQTKATLGLWFKTAVGNANRRAIVFRRDSTTPGLGLAIDYNGTNVGKMTLLYRYSGGAGYITSSTSTWADGSWHHAMLVYDLPNVTLYLDGSQAVTANNAVAATFDSGAFGVTLGGDRGAGGATWDGSIDEIRVAIGTAASAGWVTSTYNSQKDGTVGAGKFLKSLTTIL